MSRTTNHCPSNVFMVDHKILHVHVVSCSRVQALVKPHVRVGFYVLCTAVVPSASSRAAQVLRSRPAQGYFSTILIGSLPRRDDAQVLVTHSIVLLLCTAIVPSASNRAAEVLRSRTAQGYFSTILICSYSMYAQQCYCSTCSYSMYTQFIVPHSMLYIKNSINTVLILSVQYAHISGLSLRVGGNGS
jgi:hypothetical protein